MRVKHFCILFFLFSLYLLFPSETLAKTILSTSPIINNEENLYLTGSFSKDYSTIFNFVTQTPSPLPDESDKQLPEELLDNSFSFPLYSSSTEDVFYEMKELDFDELMIIKKTRISEILKEKRKHSFQTNYNDMYDKLEKDAFELLGVPYVWGGTTIKGFDCSGYVIYVYKKQGVSLPRTTYQMWSSLDHSIQLSKGDLVFFQTYAKGPSHVGIYIGNNKFIHSGGTKVNISSLKEQYWDKRYIGARKVDFSSK